MNSTAATIAADVCQLAENPLWDAVKKCVYWTDIPAGKLYSLDVATSSTQDLRRGIGRWIYPPGEWRFISVSWK